MSMSISLRGRTQHAESPEGPAAAQSSQSAQGARPAQQASAHGEPAVVHGGGPSAAAQRFDRISNNTAPTVCRETVSDSALAAQYRAAIARGETPQIPVAPPLPRRDGATLARELNVPRAQLPAADQRILNADSAPITGYLMPRAIHAFEGIAHVPGGSLGHFGVEVSLHAVAEGAAHLLAHTAAAASGAAIAGGAIGTAGRAALAGSTAASVLNHAMVADMTVGAVIETAIRLNNGTLPTPIEIQRMIREHAPEIIAQSQQRVEQRLEQQFNAGALAAARGEAPASDASPAFSRGYSEGAQYRRQHGCEFDAHTQSLRVLNSVTRGTPRDPSAGVRPLTTERQPTAGVVTQQQMSRWLEDV
jgi:hypothetical protein